MNLRGGATLIRAHQNCTEVCGFDGRERAIVLAASVQVLMSVNIDAGLIVKELAFKVRIKL